LRVAISSVICAHSRRTPTNVDTDVAVETLQYRPIVSLTITYGTSMDGSNQVMGCGSPAAVPPPHQSMIETARSLVALSVLIANEPEPTADAGSPRSEKIPARKTPVVAGAIASLDPASMTSQCTL